MCKQDFQCSDIDDAQKNIASYLKLKNWDQVENIKKQINDSDHKVVMSVYRDQATQYQIHITNDDQIKQLEKVVIFLKANKDNSDLNIPKIIDCFEDDQKALNIFVEDIITQTVGRSYKEFIEGLYNMTIQEQAYMFLGFLRAKNEFGKLNIDQTDISHNFIYLEPIPQVDHSEEIMKKLKNDKKALAKFKKKLERKREQEDKQNKSYLVLDPFFNIINLPTQLDNKEVLFAPELYDKDIVDQKTTFYVSLFVILSTQLFKFEKRLNFSLSIFKQHNKQEYLTDLVQKCKYDYNLMFTHDKPSIFTRFFNSIKSIFSRNTSTIYKFADLCEHLGYDKEQRKSNEYYINSLQNCYKYSHENTEQQHLNSEFSESTNIKVI